MWRALQRFFRADPSGHIPEMGLGMSLVKEIVTLHEGQVDVASEFGGAPQMPPISGGLKTTSR